MANANKGKPWDPAEWSRFGEPESLTVTRYDPNVVQAFYYPVIDMTVFVNTRADEVEFWRFGRATR